MGTNFLQPLTSKSSPPTPFIFTKPFVKHLQISLHCHRRSLWVSPINSTNTSSSDNNTANGDGAQPTVPRPVTPPNTVEIKYRRRSRRQSRRQREDGVGNGQLTKAQPQASASDPPKKWEDMSFAEKAIELYVGEKGLLFWLNKFAYASIFIVIGGWILFRFVGPSLNLYQLDSAPLAPTSIFKGP